ncbi:hypothetical protein [Mycolicibacterium goodii]|uniref:Bacteriophage protein n=1 Tax=Mycolicibacterium goodii TaxID=134601 RepID=A0ABS6HFN9_MYCGD|nr:hypothetical protein [Mycolicibacterium goodii]MBU8821487.1 hypothetical protein [Mycolicibacterium goodii]MBU8836189.1 hypothetical protein [Mycolicibacterium goodii]
MSQRVTRTEVIKNALVGQVVGSPTDLNGGRISGELAASLTERIEDELFGYASTAELLLEARTIRTVEELDRLPVGVVVRSAEGSIACRFDATRGVVFGDERPFPWVRLALTARVLWTPDEAG